MFMSNEPIDPGDEKYVPTGFADALVELVDLGNPQVLIVVGPVGVGKSTELRQVYSMLPDAVFVDPSTTTAMHKMTAGMLSKHIGSQWEAHLGGEPKVLVLDGLTNCGANPNMADIFQLLRDYARHTTVIVALPHHLTYVDGPAIVEGERVLEMAVKPVEQWAQFFKMVLLQRGLEVTPNLEDAAHYSGGIPRIFLQLVSKSAIGAGDGLLYSFKDVLYEHVESRKRVLGNEDLKNFAEFVAGSDVHLTPDLLLRYLAYGHLLVVDTEAGYTLVVHPLVQEVVKNEVLSH